MKINDTPQRRVTPISHAGKGKGTAKNPFKQQADSFERALTLAQKRNLNKTREPIENEET